MENTVRKTSYKKYLPWGILLVTIIAVVLIVTSLQLSKSGKLYNQKPVATLPAKQVLLFFKPNTLTVSQNGSFTADLAINAGDGAVNSITTDIAYDPAVLKNVKVTPYKDKTSALSYSFDSKVTSETPGQTTITYSLINGAISQKGTGIIAKISGTYAGKTTAIITLAQESSVTTDSTEYTLNLGRVNLELLPR